jgi:type I site-specific restriction-modification system R (restriction) subunit
MIPINQVILGGGDPLLGNSMVGNSLDEQLQLIEKYKQNLEAAKQLRQQAQSVQQPVPQRMIWDEIDAEINPMTDEQKTRMLQDEDYVDTYTKIQDMVQAEILNLVKGRIEATPEGKELLQRQLKIVKKLKGKIIQETNREMEMFRKFREFSKTHPEVTYEEFIKASM